MGVLKLSITHNLCPNQTWAELPFDDSIPLQQVRTKICRHVGSEEQFVKLFLCSDGKTPDVCLDDLHKTLGSYSVKDGGFIHVVDEDPNSILKEINDTGNQPRYRLTDEQYASKPGTAKEFLAKLRAEKPELFQKATVKANPAGGDQHADQVPSHVTNEIIETAKRMNINKRCQIKDTSIRGTIRYIGHVSDSLAKTYGLNQDEIVVGIQLDDAVGNFDGKDEHGKVLIECSGSTGGTLVPLQRVEVGEQFGPLSASNKDEI